MNTETKNCQNCKTDFTVESEDFAFYEKMAVPAPTFCPECRMVRRLTFRNERALYKRTCDLCHEAKIMMYPDGTPFPVFCFSCWWSDNWNAESYARPYDFSKPFFEQFKALMYAVPRPGVIKQGNSVESEYTNRVTDQKRCYLVYGSINSEDCRYSVWANDSKQVVDCYNVLKSERCHECIDCYQCSNLSFSQESRECSYSAFLFNCRNLSNCVGCVNLRGKSYCIFNQQYTKEEYEAKLAELKLGTIEGSRKVREEFEKLRRASIMPWAMIYHSTDTTGNWIDNCKNTQNSFTCNNIEEGRYLYGLSQGKDLMDYWQWSAGSERIYEAINTGIQCSNLKFSNECWSQVIDSEYVMNCHSSKNLFGSIGVKKGEYVVFNQQYSREEYEDLVTRIKKHMNEMPYHDARGRSYAYGEYFPIELSPFSYNETLAQEFFPITKEKADEERYPWRASETRNYAITVQPDALPASIEWAGEGITKEVVGCSHAGTCIHQCTTAFRILPEDLQLYTALKVPLPRLCPNCRHYERLAARNPLKLWSRPCQCAGNHAQSGTHDNTASHFHGDAQCPNQFETSYSADRPEIVYCEQCYQAEVA
jgi:hypothetical protein